MFYLDRLDFNIAYACNLSCKGCISLSDFDRKGVEPLDSLLSQIDQWKRVITPKVLTLFGGEPLLHPKLHNLIDAIRDAWPTTRIRLITNGYLLKKHDPAKWFDYKPFEIQVSIHRSDHAHIINKEIKRILDHKTDWRYKRVGDGKDHRDLIFYTDGFELWKSRFKDFVQPYQLEDGRLVPHNSNPADAHASCGSPDTPVLYKNKLYKCPPVANILDVQKDFVYDYQAVENEIGLEKFVNDIGKPESVCSMCPANADNPINHFDKENVIVKHID